ncbi:unnamed protein product [Spodoptera littoralis]|uniref:BRCT domain-containing protein n=1 Tax=Spodoptera littoralis TaxID=7109 RepID=A0A9P0HZM6_SPOLI|nr:unnamed protein product [Spodoptera littoralis]CAH1637121.1 unnamed protein product [Spodoptera littoralis]
MPRVKIDYIVSFSSEDPEHPASNLLNLEVSKKKWLCAKGERTCSVVLQLPRAVKISSLNIGAYHAALVEVLVGRSESTNEQYQWQVLVPSCVFALREESRRGAELARVRSFSGAQLAPGARAGRWDRLRLVCQQPHDRRQFGLSFVHIDEAESSTPAGVPQRLLALDTFSSDEDDFKPGELFAKHLQKTNAEDITPPSNTGAQIRQATSQALKNISDFSTKLIKNPIVKPSGSCNDNKATASRRPDVQVRQSGPRPDEGAPPRQTAQTSAPAETSSSAKRNLDSAKSSTDQNRQLETKKRVRSENRERPSVPTECLLRGATLVLSGYENPRRAAVRRAALALGARLQPAWGPACTHLICAFPNTPKLRAARAAGRAVPVARAEWLDACLARRRLLPWQWYATEPERRVTPPDSEPDDSERDTDDEIEKVLRDQKKRRTEASTNNEVELRDGSDSDGQATEDEAAPAPAAPRPPAGALPAFLDGCTFSLRAASAAAAARLARYVRAYGGDVLADGATDDATDGAQYELDARGAAWLARCHAAQALLPYP